MGMIYLDYNATSPMKPAVRSAVLEAMERHGNPSSVHRFGRIARRHVEEARASVAAFVGVKPVQVIFTSGGTEANNAVIYAQPWSAVATSAIEHDSILAATPSAVRLPVTASGVIDLEKTSEIMKGLPRGSLVSVMLVNNETGVIQPVSEIGKICLAHGHFVHTDGVQAAGRVPIDFSSLNVDCLTLSAHKVAGPQGIGAIIVKEGVPFSPLLVGGGQEKNRRAGTENVAAIVGFGVAAQLAADDLRDMPRLIIERDRLQTQMEAVGGNAISVIGKGAPRVANTLCVAIRDVASETQVVAMDLAGIAVSAGSACSSGKVKASHVLRAMDQAPDIISSALRISLGWNTEPNHIDRCFDAWNTILRRTRSNQNTEAA